MNKVAICIGVKRTGYMPELPSACDDARAFGQWAVSQRFTPYYFLDDEGAVLLHQIHDKVNKVRETGQCEVLMIYFAGHGVLSTLIQEFWLLSNAPTNPNEAISVQPSQLFAKFSGIPHVVFISDSCRSDPPNRLVKSVIGGVIFPAVEQNTTRPVIDMFYATALGDPAFEKSTVTAMAERGGFYTVCLLEALKGEVPEVLTNINESGIEVAVVEARKLHEYLLKAVPLAVEKASGRLTQEPDAEIRSNLPKYLSIFYPGDISETQGTKPQDPESNGEAPEIKKVYKSTLSFTASANDFRDQIIERDKRSILAANRLGQTDAFSTGITVVGSLQRITPITTDDFEILQEGFTTRIAVKENQKQHMLLQFLDGTSFPIAVLQGFNGIVTLAEGKVIGINYSPTPAFRFFQDYQNQSQEIEDRRATIAASAKNGTFIPDGHRDELAMYASYLRKMKLYDPSLGLYAAYAYTEIGDLASAESIYQYMVREPEPVLFDVAMLSQLGTKDLNRAVFRRTAGICPMFNKGWSYLSLFPDNLSEYLVALAKHRIPGHWTTFTQEGTEMYAAIMYNNNL